MSTMTKTRVKAPVTLTPARNRLGQHQSLGPFKDLKDSHQKSLVSQQPLIQPEIDQCSNFPRRYPFGGACHTCPVHVQPKLKISQPDDEYEREADRVAETVMRMSEPKKDDEEPYRHPGCMQTLQRSAVNTATLDEFPPIVQEVLNSPGQPLDGKTRAFMEPRFGHDFSKVRIHADAKAVKSARAVNALAFTVSKHIVFATNQYPPESDIGQQFMAHELTHIIQQNNQPSTVQKDATFGQKILYGKMFSVPEIQHPPLLQRATAEDLEQPDAKADITAEQAWSRQSPEGMVLDLPEQNRWILWNFDVASARLKLEHKKALSTIAKDYWPLVKRYQGVKKIHISGHASKTGIHAQNIVIADRRAEEVKKFLAQKCLIDDKDILIDSYGDMMPFACYGDMIPLSSSGDPSMLAVDRRVELIFEREQVKPAPPISPRKTKSTPRELEKETLDLIPPDDLKTQLNEEKIYDITHYGATTGETLGHIVEIVGVAERVAISSALLFAIVNTFLTMGSIQRAQQAGKKLAAIKAVSYVIVALAHKIPIPNVPLREEWSYEAKKEWDRTLEEVKHEVTWEVNKFKYYRDHLKYSREKASQSKDYYEDMIKAGKIASILKTLATMNNEEGLNVVFGAISEGCELESYLKW